MTATIRLRTTQLDRHTKRLGLTTDTAKAHAFGITRPTVARALAGDNRPGEQFIAAVLNYFADLRFEDLFEVVEVAEVDDEDERGAA